MRIEERETMRKLHKEYFWMDGREGVKRDVDFFFNGLSTFYGLVKE